MKQDVKIFQKEETLFDIDFDANGDFLLAEDLETSIWMQLFTDLRGKDFESSQIDNRGFFGDEIENYETGSKLWLAGAKKLPEIRARIADYVEKSLEYLLIENSIDKLDVDVQSIENGYKITVTTTQNNKQNKIEVSI